MSIHDERTVSLLVHLAADFIAREAGRKTLITPTRAHLGKEAATATIFVSVYPKEETPHALEFLARNRDEFRAFLRSHSRLSRLPHVTFAEDVGEQNRQHLDELSRELESR